MATIDGFLPSSHGFRFRNSWPRGTPAVVIDVGVGTMRLGDANSGLCGGMALAAADLHAAGRHPRRWTTPPAGGTEAFRYLSRRLLASWGVPAGPARFAYWALTPDQDTIFGLRAGLRRLTIRDELPRVEAGIGRGRPVLLGLVTVRSATPAQLAECHIVLAYGCTRTAGRAEVAVYDPNSPGRDDLAIGVDTTDPGGARPLVHNVGLRRPIRGFFVLPYRVADPTPVAGPRRRPA
jgi:hypothetical protein